MVSSCAVSMVLQDKSIYYNTLTYQFTSLTYSRVTCMHIYDSNLKEVVMLEVYKALTNVSTIADESKRRSHPTFALHPRF